ncbi:Uncharacterised protein [Achromobacter sp. 2789STDY5608615]|nr:Uncharacterised protein [Achromobacter sp. 2789STDY5608615]
MRGRTRLVAVLGDGQVVDLAQDVLHPRQQLAVAAQLGRRQQRFGEGQAVAQALAALAQVVAGGDVERGELGALVGHLAVPAMQAPRQLLVQLPRVGLGRQHRDDGGLDAGTGDAAFQADGWFGRDVAGHAVGDRQAVAGRHRGRHVQAPFQQFQQPGLEGLAAGDGAGVLFGRRRFHGDDRHAGAHQRGGHGFVQHVLVAVGAEGGEVRAHALHDGVGDRRDPAVEQLPARAQAADADAQLVHVFGVAGAVHAFGVDLGQHRGVARDLVQAFGGDAAHGLGRGHVFAQLDGGGAARRPELGDGLGAAAVEVVAGDGVNVGQALRQLGQRVAALGLAARVQHQAVALLPAARDREDGGGAARDQFEFEFGDRQLQRAGAQDAGVIGQLDRAVAGAHLAQHALHVGFIAQAEFALDGGQRGLDFGAGVDRQVEHGAGPRVVQFDAGDGVDAGHLEGLHPVAAFLAQANGDAGLGQFTLGRVEVHRMQADARRLALLDLSQHGLAGSRGHVQFQFLFRHGGGCPTAKAEILIKGGGRFDDRSYLFHKCSFEHRPGCGASTIVRKPFDRHSGR